ncbi:MAG: T9SS type A sorting domain-containing protein [Chlorobi bacterium]|nr:T9SS type A sorting domain-containing protein [Chlorobiota bacterium]
MKPIYTFLLTIVISFLMLPPVPAQQIKSTKGHSQFRFKASLEQMQAWDRAHPNVEIKKKKHNEEEAYPEFPIEGKNILFEGVGSEHSGTSPIFKEPSPLPDADFLGLEDSGNSIPPDVNGAAGPDHLMVTLNTGFRILDKEGNIIADVSTGAFWFGMPGAGEVFDPKIMYDPYENRWMLVEPSSSNIANSRLYVAVSENSDPTGNWFMYAFESDPEKQYWFDYPSYGFNKKWIVVSGNMFGAGFGYNVLFAFDKMAIYNNAEEVFYTRFKIFDGFTIVPALTYDTELEDMYMVNNAGGNNGGSGYLNLWKLSGELGSEEVQDLGLIGTPNPWTNWAGNSGNFAPQLDSEENINSGDGRMQKLIYRNGHLWCAHHIFLPADNPTHSAIQWWQLATDGTILQRGRIEDETGFYHYTFPSIAVNAKEDVMIGYGSFSPGQYASSSYSFRYADDPVNEMRDRYQFKDGLAKYVKTFGGARNRWGDYTATVIDPSDDLDFWTLQEFADLPTGSTDHWGTWWAMINIDDIPLVDFEAGINIVPTGTATDFTDKTKYEPTEWLWLFEGGNPSTSTEQNPQDIVYETSGTFDVTLIATNYLGSDTLKMEDFINVNTSILPEVGFMQSDTLPCVGQTVEFEDISVYNPSGWQWSFVPDEVTFVDGTNANSQHPKVQFNSATYYEVSLTATNVNGSSTLNEPMLIKSGGMSLPFSEDFESKSFNSMSWSVENEDDSKTWEITDVAGNEPGNLAAWVNIKNYNGFEERDRLITPLLNFTDFETAFLEFEHAYGQRFPQYTDSLNVYISNDCGQNWTSLLRLGEDGSGVFATVEPSTTTFVPLTSEDWCLGTGEEGNCYLINLEEWTGQANLKIMFESYNGFGNNLFIDNIKIKSAEAVGETFGGKGNFQLFPNPNSGTFSIVLENYPGNASYRVFNLTGQVISDGDLEENGGIASAELNISNEPKGIYFVKVTYAGKTESRKLIIQ